MSLSAAFRPKASVKARERRGRDSNPRWSFDPHTRLAGECLQPLGHLSLSGEASVEPGGGDRAARSICGCLGRVAERLNAAVLKTVDGGNVVRGFESPPF